MQCISEATHFSILHVLSLRQLQVTRRGGRESLATVRNASVTFFLFFPFLLYCLALLARMTCVCLSACVCAAECAACVLSCVGALADSRGALRHAARRNR